MSDDDPDDPFESLDAPDDVDPFEDLEGPDGAADDDTDVDQSAASDPDSQPTTGADADSSEGGYTPPGQDADVAFGADAVSRSDDTADAEADADDPFASFQGAAGQTGGADDDPFGAFESIDVEGVDPDTVWAELSSAEAGETPDFDEKVFYEVSKHQFCENCEHFSAPPEVKCTFEGAAIVEFLDMETVRLLNCPIVAEQRALEEGVNDIGDE